MTQALFTGGVTTVQLAYDQDALTELNRLAVQFVDVFAACVVIPDTFDYPYDGIDGPVTVYRSDQYLKHSQVYTVDVTTIDPVDITVCPDQGGVDVTKTFRKPAYGTVANAWKDGVKVAECALVDGGNSILTVTGCKEFVAGTLKTSMWYSFTPEAQANITLVDHAILEMKFVCADGKAAKFTTENVELDVEKEFENICKDNGGLMTSSNDPRVVLNTNIDAVRYDGILNVYDQHKEPTMTCIAGGNRPDFKMSFYACHAIKAKAE